MACSGRGRRSAICDQALGKARLASGAQQVLFWRRVYLKERFGAGTRMLVGSAACG